MDSQGEDRTVGALLMDCYTEWILMVRTGQVSTSTGQLSTSSGLLHRMDSQGEDSQVVQLFRTAAQNGSQGEDSPGGAPLQDCCTE
jgi:hypothetical protein